MLCRDGDGSGEVDDRKGWLEKRLQKLTGLFAIDCACYAIMDNHFHVLLRLDSTRAESWSDAEVARRWLRLFPVRDVKGNALPVSKARVAELADDPIWVAKIRQRLVNLGWFMKCLKEPLARSANKRDGCSGAFWEGRYKCIAVIGEEALLATAAYIELNPLAAGIATVPEEAPHTSLHARIANCRAQGTLETVGEPHPPESHTTTAQRFPLETDAAVTKAPAPEPQNPAQQRELWLLPLDDQRAAPGQRAGLIAGCTLSHYLQVIDWTSRLVRAGKACVDADIPPIVERLGVDSSVWIDTMSRLLAESQRTGSFFGSPSRLADAARTHGRRWHRNQIRREPKATRTAV